MRLLVYGINYLPEKIGIGKYTGEMCMWFADRGHDVRVITAPPYYPDWRIHSGYTNRFQKEDLDGVKVHRHPLYVPMSLSGTKRILHEVSFILSSGLGWLKMIAAPRFDVVICIAPPFHSGLFGWLFSKLCGAKFVYHVQDLQVDASKELGMIRNRRLLRLLDEIERFILRRADLVSSISDGMARKLKQKSSNKQITLLPNWVDTEFLRPISFSDSLRGDWGYDANDFVILYSGNLGEKQGLEILLEAATHFLPDKSIRFVICGNGGSKEKLQKIVQERNLTNVAFKDLQPWELLPRLLAIADVHLILQRKAAEDLVMPSKLTGILSVGGVPIVSCSEGSSLHEILNTHAVGLVVPPEDVGSLIAAIAHQSNTRFRCIKAIRQSIC